MLYFEVCIYFASLLSTSGTGLRLPVVHILLIINQALVRCFLWLCNSERAAGGRCLCCLLAVCSRSDLRPPSNQEEKHQTQRESRTSGESHVTRNQPKIRSLSSFHRLENPLWTWSSRTERVVKWVSDVRTLPQSTSDSHFDVVLLTLTLIILNLLCFNKPVNN